MEAEPVADKKVPERYINNKNSRRYSPIYRCLPPNFILRILFSSGLNSIFMSHQNNDKDSYRDERGNAYQQFGIGCDELSDGFFEA